MAKLVIKNTQGNASQLEFDRNGNANWLVTSNSGYLRFQSDWNNTKGNYEDILVLSEATTGSATLKGSFTTGGDIVSAKGIFSKTINGEADVGVRYGDGKYLYLWGSDTSGRRGLWDTDFGGIIGISDNGRYFMGQSTSATRIDYPAQLTSDSAIDNFNIANGFQVGTWNSTSTPGVTNGIIINAGWTSTSYGAQIAIDDDPTYYIALRQRGTGGWSGWKRIPMADGTGASGTWGINITGSSGSAIKATYLEGSNDSMKLYAEQSNEINFGGTNAATTIYFGYRAKDSKPIPTNFIFGGSSGTATITANYFTGTAALSNRLAIKGTPSGDNHALALKNYFESNKNSIPKNELTTYYSTAYGNGSLYMGYFLSGYDSTPYGGFFVAHYDTPYYVGIQYNSYNQQTILTSSNYSSWCAPASHSHSSYLPLSGGTLTGKLQVNAPIFGYNYSNSNNAAAFIFDKPSSNYTGIGAGGYSDIIHFGPCTADGTWVSNYNQIWRFQGCVYALGWLESDNYGSSAPGSSTPGYGRNGAIYFKV